MELAGRFVIRCKPESTQHLYHLTDVHLLSAACATSQFEDFLKRIVDDPIAKVVGTGDYIEGIDYKDIRFSPQEFPVTVRVCDLADYGTYSFDLLYKYLQPIAHKILGLGFGNHEEVLLRRTNSWHLWDQLVAKLGCANLGYASFLDLIYRVGKADHIFRVTTHHGAGWPQKVGGVATRVKDFMDTFETDIFLMGHLHQRLVYHSTILGASPDLTRLCATERLGIVGASYLRTYAKGVSTYAEKRGYKTAPIGNPCVLIQPETRHLGVDW